MTLSVGKTDEKSVSLILKRYLVRGPDGQGETCANETLKELLGSVYISEHHIYDTFLRGSTFWSTYFTS